MVGARDGYSWVTSHEHNLDGILQSCPEVLLGRWLAITSTDSGDPTRWAGKLPGRDCRGGIAYSPRLESLEEIRYQTDGKDCAGFDDWFIFDAAPVDLGKMIKGENPWAEETKIGLGRLVAFVDCYFSPECADGFLSGMFGIKSAESVQSPTCPTDASA